MGGIERVAAVMGERLGWGAARQQAEIDAYRAELAATLVPLDALDC
jgi:hypothetical protein